MTGVEILKEQATQHRKESASGRHTGWVVLSIFKGCCDLVVSEVISEDCKIPQSCQCPLSVCGGSYRKEQNGEMDRTIVPQRESSLSKKTSRWKIVSMESISMVDNIIVVHSRVHDDPVILLACSRDDPSVHSRSIWFESLWSWWHFGQSVLI